MKKSRFLSMLLAVVMLITCTSNAVTGAFAATNPTIMVDTLEGKPGDEVTLTVSLSNNPGICSLRLAVNYDTQLTLTAVEDAGLMNDHVFGRQLTANPYYVTWDDSLEDDDNTGNGALVYLTFKVNDDATSGDHKVWITYKHGEIYNLDLDDVDFETVDGGVTVVGGAHEHVFTNYVSDGNATCTQDGTKTAQCDFGCGTTDTIVDEGSKIPHSFTNYSPDNNATCTENGTKTATCDYGCGTTDTIEIADSELGHSFTHYVSNNDATCTADGTKTAKCDRCDETDTITDVGSKIPHSFVDYHSDNNATCTADGTKTAYCEYGCGTKDTIADEGSKIPHSFSNYVYNNDATYDADGTETAHCDYGCGETDTHVKTGSKLIDTIAPTGEVKVEKNGWKSFLNTITFGLFFKEKFDVTITGEDNETGVKNIEYYKSSVAMTEEAVAALTEWTTGTSFSVESEGQYVIYVKITDNAGNVTYISTDGLVIDNSVPQISGVEDGASYCETVTAIISGENIESVTLNGKNVTVVSGKVELTAVSSSGTTYNLKVTTKSGNTAEATVKVYDGHNFDNYVSDGNATCTADGTKTAVCAHGCGATDTIADVGSKVDHKYTNYVSDGNATCTADGTKTAQCDYGCGETDTVVDSGSALGHSFTNYVSNNDATCEADGTKTAKCDRCDETDTIADEGSALGHDYKLTSTVPATCEEDGKKVYVCTHDNSHTYEEVIEKLGHDWGEWVVTTEPTCTEKGIETHTCKNNPSHTETRDVDALGHSFTNYVSDENATCTADGTKTAKCDHNCGVTDTVADEGSKLSHTIIEWTITIEPTVNEFGEKTGICTVCKETVTEQIEKLKEKLTDTDNNATVEGLDGFGFADDVQFNVEDITDKLTENELTAINSAIGSLAEGKERIRVFDLELLLNGQKYEFSGKVKVTIPLDSNALKAYKDIQFIHIKGDNTYENVSFEIVDGKLVFEATSFSNFVLVGVNTNNNGSENNNQGNNGDNSGNNSDVNQDNNNTSPQTGDDSHLGLWIILMFASAIALIGCIVFGRKRSHNH